MGNNWRDWLSKGVKGGAKHGKTGTKHAAKASPIVKTVSVVQGMYKLTQIGNKVSDVADTINTSVPEVLRMTEEFVNKASTVIDNINEAIPTIQIMVGSVCDKISFLAQFATVASAIGAGANMIQTYQGAKALNLINARLEAIGETLEAQTVLMAEHMFGPYVYDMVVEALDGTSGDPNFTHWFFVYHPDNAWSPGFHKLIKEKNPGPRFCGHTKQLDTLFAFMLAAREEMKRKELEAQARGKRLRPVKFHILIPAYTPVVITDYHSFPEGLGDFVIEGKLHKSQELVWLNIPENQNRFLQDVGIWKPPAPGILESWFWPKPQPNPRVLGTKANSREGDQEKQGNYNDEDARSVSSATTTGIEGRHYRNKSLRQPDKKTKNSGGPNSNEHSRRHKGDEQNSPERHQEGQDSMQKPEPLQSQHSRSRGRSRAGHPRSHSTY